MQLVQVLTSNDILLFSGARCQSCPAAVVSLACISGAHCVLPSALRQTDDKELRFRRQRRRRCRAG